MAIRLFNPAKVHKDFRNNYLCFRRNGRLAARLVIDWLYKLKDLRFYPTRTVLLIPRPLAEEQIMMFLPRFG